MNSPVAFVSVLRYLQVRRLAAGLAATALLGISVIPFGCEQPSVPRTEEPEPLIGNHKPPSDVPEPAGPDAQATVPSIDSRDSFFGEPDAPRRTALSTRPIATIEKGRGGRSLAFKITLDDGTVGYFKPEQTFSAAHWYSEVAAYYLDRELGFGRVAPLVGRRFEWEPLRAIAASDDRIDEVVVRPDGTVRGAFIWWIPGDLERLSLGRGWERWLRMPDAGIMSISPFQRPEYYTRQMAEYRRLQRASTDPTRVEAPPPLEGADLARAEDPDHPDRPAELSDMIVFDYLVSNVDRWGGQNTNVRTLERGGPLIFLDNAAGFWSGPNQRLGLMDQRLRTIHRFRRATIERVRMFQRSAFERRLASDALAPILTAHQIDGLEERRAALLEYVGELEDRYGAAVYY